MRVLLVLALGCLSMSSAFAATGINTTFDATLDAHDSQRLLDALDWKKVNPQNGGPGGYDVISLGEREGNPDLTCVRYDEPVCSFKGSLGSGSAPMHVVISGGRVYVQLSPRASGVLWEAFIGANRKFVSSDRRLKIECTAADDCRVAFPLE
jgi:hypothetical protein